MNRKVLAGITTFGCLIGVQAFAEPNQQTAGQNQQKAAQNQNAAQNQQNAAQANQQNAAQNQQNAAQNRQGQENQQFRQGGQQAQWQNADHMLATCVAIGNQEEIAVAKFAEEKAKNNDVKEFARMMQKDHQSFLQKLQRFAPEASREGYLSDQNQRTGNDQRNEGQRVGSNQQNQNQNNPNQQNANQQNQNQQNQNQNQNQNQPNQQNAGTQVRVQPPGGQVNVAVGGNQQQFGNQGWHHHLDFMALHRELAENCLQQTKEMLSKKDSGKFDECFIGLQIAKHAEMKNKLTVFERHASPELKQILAEGLQTTEHHLKRAEDIMKKLSDSQSSNSKSSS